MILPTAVSIWLLPACLSIVAGACVSPDSFIRTDGGPEPGDPSGAGGGSARGGASGAGTGGKTTGSGSGGSPASGAGGAIGGLGGRPGIGGTTGAAGSSVIGPAANFTDNFENNDIALHWLAPQNNTTLSGTNTPCGTWGVAADGATNHVYQQSSTACTDSNPSWAAGGAVTWTNMRLQVKVRFAPGASNTTITIAVRYNNPKDLYWVEFKNNGGLKIRTRTLTGSAVDVGSPLASNMRVAVPDGQWTTIGLSISGTTINAYLGDNPAAPPVLTGTASGQVSGGIAIGVATGTASFDDVVVTPS